MRKELGLDYGRFNLLLLALDESPLSNEPELRSVYQGYLARLRPEILERLRRRYAADFRSGRDLADYVARKRLEFLPFDANWILTREKLDQGVVDAHVSRLLDDALGSDKDIELPPFRSVLERNRRTVRDFAAGAAPAVAAWCRRNVSRSKNHGAVRTHRALFGIWRMRGCSTSSGSASCRCPGSVGAQPAGRQACL